MSLRVDALCLVGVSHLNTREIQKYVRSHLSAADENIPFTVEWVDDDSIVLAFTSEADALNALYRITEADAETEMELEAREGKKCKPFVKHFSELLSRTATAVAEEPPATLYVRRALETDRKIKNAREFSRYYLLNGEPAYSSRRPRRSERHSGPEEPSDPLNDLFPIKLGVEPELVAAREEAEAKAEAEADVDLFAHKQPKRDFFAELERNANHSHGASSGGSSYVPAAAAAPKGPRNRNRKAVADEPDLFSLRMAAQPHVRRDYGSRDRPQFRARSRSPSRRL